jgi:hypothetical protein
MEMKVMTTQNGKKEESLLSLVLQLLGYVGVFVLFGWLYLHFLNTDHVPALEARLKGQGYELVKVEAAPLVCPDGVALSARFTATNKEGKTVHGTVCSAYDSRNTQITFDIP